MCIYKANNDDDDDDDGIPARIKGIKCIEHWKKTRKEEK